MRRQGPFGLGRDKAIRLGLGRRKFGSFRDAFLCDPVTRGWGDLGGRRAESRNLLDRSNGQGCSEYRMFHTWIRRVGVGDEVLPGLIERLHHRVEPAFWRRFFLITTTSEVNGDDGVHVLVVQELGRDLKLRSFQRDGRARPDETLDFIFASSLVDGKRFDSGPVRRDPGRRKVDDGGGRSSHARFGFRFLVRRAVERVEFDQSVSEWQVVTRKIRTSRPISFRGISGLSKRYSALTTVDWYSDRTFA